MKKNEQGFTLVELAIVMIIIGLLIGGVLKGQELIENAKINSIISNVKGYQAALNMFQDTYAGVPGDMANAATRLSGCAAGNTNNCVNGSGNSIVGVPAEAWETVDSTIGGENTQLWKHLALADLVTGINPSAAAIAWGESHPASGLSGGFHARYSVIGGGGNASMNGNILVLRNNINGNWSCGSDCTVSPLQAAQMDRKMDDGIADTGTIQAVSATWNNGCGVKNAGTNGPTGYDEQSVQKTCDVMFNIGG